jgi:copper chaperone CopZ
MKRLFGILLLPAVLLLGGAGVMTIMQPSPVTAVAAERSVTLAVDNLKGNCPSCAFIVRSALSDVEGVARVEVSMQTGTATVFYDEGKVVDLAALSQATEAVGFPSQPFQ